VPSLTDRERNVVALAFGNLEKTIASLPDGTVKWDPPLTRDEVATLRCNLLGQRSTVPVCIDCRKPMHTHEGGDCRARYDAGYF
jgi:hypothetical protein